MSWNTLYSTGFYTGGGGGGLGGCPPNKIKPCLIFNSIQAYPYSTYRQVEISFLGMPQIAHFQVEKWKSSLPKKKLPLPHPPPARSLRSLGLGHFTPSQRLRLRHCYTVCTRLHHFKLKSAKAPYRGGGGGTSPSLASLARALVRTWSYQGGLRDGVPTSNNKFK